MKIHLLMFVVSLTLTGGLRENLAQRQSVQVSSTIIVDTREGLQHAIASARPGTKVLVAPGTYRAGLSFSGLVGTKQAPIVIAAQQADQPPVFQGGSSCFHFRQVEYLELHQLILTGGSGNGLNIDDGGGNNEPAHHILLRDLQIRDIGPKGNRDGIKLSGVDHFKIEGCKIERWGDGGSAIDMVGCHHGQVTESVFRYRDDIFANGVQTKGGSANVSVTRCRFEHAGGRAVNIGGSTGLDYFRPKFAGYEAKDILVEDCTFLGSSAPVAFVGVDGATVRYNTFYRPTRWVLRILQESQGEKFVPCRNGVFSHNLIVYQSEKLRTVVNVGGGTSPQSFTFADNHWYCADNPQRSKPRSLPVAESNGSYGLKPHFLDESKGDLRFAEANRVQNAGVRRKNPQTQ